MAIAPIPELVAELAAGRMVILVDEEDRENEGDLVLAADHVTPEAINFMAKYGRGLICLTLTLEEMGLGDTEEVVKKIRAIPGYVRQFERMFGEENPVDLKNLTKALASYERTLITPESPYDRFLRGETYAITSQAREGMWLFDTVGCLSCHDGPALGGGSIKKFPRYPGSEYETKYQLADDPGRFNVTQNESDRNAWRVAPLRNVALTAPYFHNGSVETLAEAIKVMGKTQLGIDLKEAEVLAIKAFLHSLTGRQPIQTLPQLPPLGDERSRAPKRVVF